VGIKVAEAVVFLLFEELDEEERGLDIRSAEAEILVIAAKLLVVQVDVEELAGAQAPARRRA
jgi:hypothetical protein